MCVSVCLCVCVCVCVCVCACVSVCIHMCMHLLHTGLAGFEGPVEIGIIDFALKEQYRHLQTTKNQHHHVNVHVVSINGTWDKFSNLKGGGKLAASEKMT